MTKKQQMNFVRELTENIASEVVATIRSGKVPDDWDGHELRCLLAEKFEASARMSQIKDEPRSKRAREYRNTVIINNL